MANSLNIVYKKLNFYGKNSFHLTFFVPTFVHSHTLLLLNVVALIMPSTTEIIETVYHAPDTESEKRREYYALIHENEKAELFLETLFINRR